MQRINIKDFFLNIGAIAALYTVVGSLLNLLFTVINVAYPKVIEGYGYYPMSHSISWPVAALIVVFPILIVLMRALEKEYKTNPEERNTGIHKFLTYFTLFVSGIIVVADLITVLYYFLDGQELTAGFLLKVLVLLIVAGSLFGYYLSDIRGTLTSKSRKLWRIVSGSVILISIILGFAVLGSPATQREYKHDIQKVNNLMEISNQVSNYYAQREALPTNLDQIGVLSYHFPKLDPQTEKAYEYRVTGATTYELCAEFNRASQEREDAYYRMYGGVSWAHGAGRDCFEMTIDPVMYGKPIPAIR